MASSEEDRARSAAAELAELDDCRRERGRERETDCWSASAPVGAQPRDGHARTPAHEHIVGDAIGAGVGPEGGAAGVGEPRAVVVIGV